MSGYILLCDGCGYRIVKYIPHLQKPDRFWPWLYRIAWSKTKQHFRNKRRWREVHFLALEDDITLRSRLQKNSHTSLNLLIQKEALKHLLTAIAKLKQPYRDVVHLRCFEQLPYSEIAPMLECTVPQARIRYFRARQYLRKLSPR